MNCIDRVIRSHKGLFDLVFTPLIGYYRTKLIANKAMDERLPDTPDENS